MRSIIRERWHEIREAIAGHKYIILIALGIMLLPFILGLAFVGIGMAPYSVNSDELRAIASERINQACVNEQTKYDWLDCSKLEIDPPYLNEGYDPNYCTDSWIAGGQVRNDKWEIIWDDRLEMSSDGKILSEDYGSTAAPEGWDKFDEYNPPKSPDDLPTNRTMTSSPCFPLPDEFESRLENQ